MTINSANTEPLFLFLLILSTICLAGAWLITRRPSQKHKHS